MSEFEERRRASDRVLDKIDGKIDKIFSVQSDMHAKQEVIKSKVERIESETIKTNGRVTRLETWQNTKKGSDKIICMIVIIVATAVVGAWVKLLFQ